MSKGNQEVVDDFNAKYPIGTLVRYWAGFKDGPGDLSHTRSEAYVLGDHTPVVFVSAKSGCIALTHIEPLEEKP